MTSAPEKDCSVFFQPGNHLAVQVIGRLVQNQQFTGADKCRSQRDLFLLPAGKMIDLLFHIRKAQTRQDRARLIAFQFTHICTDSVKDRFQQSCPGTEFRILRKVPDAHLAALGDSPLIRLFQTGQDFEQGALARSVDADNADFIPVLDIERGVGQKGFQRVSFGDMFCCKYHDDLFYINEAQRKASVVPVIKCVF